MLLVRHVQTRQLAQHVVVVVFPKEPRAHHVLYFIPNALCAKTVMFA